MSEISRYGSGERGKFRFNKESGTWEPYVEPPPVEVNAPTIITDEMLPTESPLTGKIFTSKRRLLDHYKAHGYICTWGEQPKGPERPTEAQVEAELRDDIEKAMHMVKNNAAPLTEKEKELCKEEERNYQAFKKRREAGTKVKKP